MSEAVVANRYADALFQLGTQKHTLDELVEEFGVMKQVFEDNPRLQIFLEHPSVSNEKKQQFIDSVFSAASKDVIHTLKLLVERHRSDLIAAVAESFINKVDELKGSAKAKVYSVRKLSDEELKELETTIAGRFHKNTIQFENIVDPSILGGIKIRLGNTILDGTISSKLRRIERNMRLANN
ncbi:F0F1 ATP synthase subunit delta [Virgibacillus sp. 179-BFC.A HS]|uniref:ATP synthase subunit delta n=1 Tax=Tigheibacillus jepli TaxID=3035914 RepID=A0ABU5CE07_9BACI|nr:F0F1 ATP synthase subunit delta [Virgibacillus sp. 179-BFC.A HS]MDY0404567.1 F0F1 ATP synthase subunit delta [Virgibacillus sp. 179-BFC.A HS]